VLFHNHLIYLCKDTFIIVYKQKNFITINNILTTENLGLAAHRQIYRQIFGRQNEGRTPPAEQQRIFGRQTSTPTTVVKPDETKSLVDKTSP
jgi:hypothetical protein